MDSVGVFPSVNYLYESSNLYAGLDKLDLVSTKGGGVSYFYPTINNTAPDFKTFSTGTLESLKCGSTADWMI